MIAKIKSQQSKSHEQAWHRAFVAMLPAIRRHAQISFRSVPPEAREEMTQAVIANCVVAFARLVVLGKEDLAYASALARYAVAQVRVGRNVGNRLCAHETLSHYAQHRKEFRVERLDHFDDQENEWKQIAVEDKRATPADVAAFRLDFAAWLKSLPKRERKIAVTLAAGEATSAAAKTFGVTAARISQFRRWLRESWHAFQGETNAEGQSHLAVAG